MPNFEAHVKSHNHNVIEPKDRCNVDKCNCRNKNECPLKGNCLIKNVVYRGNITTANKKHENNYVGMTENDFKGRERYHHYTFQHEDKKTSSQLANYVWDLKTKKNVDASVQYSVLAKTKPYKNGSKRCPLCLEEKFHIIFQPFKKVNQRSELVSKCRHENKFYIKNFKA